MIVAYLRRFLVRILCYFCLHTVISASMKKEECESSINNDSAFLLYALQASGNQIILVLLLCYWYMQMVYKLVG